MRTGKGKVFRRGEGKVIKRKGLRRGEGEMRGVSRKWKDKKEFRSFWK